MTSPGDVIRIPALSDNYVWLLPIGGGEAAVIDPAVDTPVLDAAAAAGLRITQILNTHWHPDHVGGNLRIKAATGAHVTGPAREAERIPGLDVAVDDGDRVPVGDLTADVLFVGAHTAGHIAFSFARERLLFPGDTLFAMGCGRLFEGTPTMMHTALAKLMALPDDTTVFCAHEYTLSNGRFALTVEPDNAALVQRVAAVTAMRERAEPTVPTTVGLERATNPFTRAGSVEELGRRRAAKDSFRG